ncbi:MAG TPA: TIM barrel protein [Chitinophagaceae bacterium]|nr:TIM barrel protein [Chitinophagaceae bacterium]
MDTRILEPEQIRKHNEVFLESHGSPLQGMGSLTREREGLIRKLMDFQVAIPSWALGTGGTRFGRFPGGGEPRNLEEKISDVGLLHSLTGSADSISLHIPWDNTDRPGEMVRIAATYGLHFASVNSNTFQDQPGQSLSYKFGSLQHEDAATRAQAVGHNLEVIRLGRELGSNSLTVWLADGSSYPGQLNFRRAFQRSLESLRLIYDALPPDWKLFIEYKAYEPHFYSTTVGDWGQSLLYAKKLGPKAFTLVDLGHHLPNANIEQIVALLLMEGRLGGFHFNDSKYGDDDLTVGCIRPYQLFLIFHELVEGMEEREMNPVTDLAWMIDASHNLKDPLEDLLQSIEAIQIAYAQALLVNQEALGRAQEMNDIVQAQEILQDAFRTDTRPLVAEARLRTEAALDPVGLFRESGLRGLLIRQRGSGARATGL